ncbi:hypothetical protein Droror1_Dr00025666 [Drosera rotundifolia]
MLSPETIAAMAPRDPAREAVMNGRSTVRMTQKGGVGGFNGKEPPRPWLNQRPQLDVDVNVGEVHASSRLEEEEKVYSWLYVLALSRNSLIFEYVESTERGELVFCRVLRTGFVDLSDCLS